MVEKGDTVLGPRNPHEPQGLRNPHDFGTTGSPGHLIGYTWNKEDSPFSSATVCKNI